MPIPRSQTGVARLLPNGMIILGSSFPITFDGQTSFSLGLWLRVHQNPPSGTLLSVGTTSLTVINGSIAFSFYLLPYFLVSGMPLDANWHYLAVTFEASQPGTGVLSMYLDGVLSGQADGAGIQAGPPNSLLVVGSQSVMDVWCLDIYSVALTPPATGCVWSPESPTPAGLVAAFCFMMNPPTDFGPNHYPIQFVGSASEQIFTPAVNCGGFGYAVPNQNEGVSPGSGGTDAFTIQAWIYSTSAVNPQIIFANGWVDESAVSLGLQIAGDQLAVVATHGSVSCTGGIVSLNEWHNVAVTYDGAVLVLYLDAVVVGSSNAGAMIAPAASTLVLGAGFNSTGTGVSNSFQGYIQSVDVWTRPLLAGEIEAYGYVAPFGQAGCVAIYDLSAAATNEVPGTPVGLFAGAANAALYVQPSDDLPAAYARDAARRKSLLAAAPAKPTRAPAAATALDAASIQRIVASFGAALPAGVPQVIADAAQRVFEQSLSEANQWVARHGRPLPGTITSTREGGEIVFWIHDERAATECFRIAASDDPCLACWISLISTIILGILTILSVSIAPSRVVNAISSRLGNGTVGRAVATVFVEEVNARTIVQALRTFFAVVPIEGFLHDVFADLSWYEILFVVSQVALQIFEILFPNPTTAEWVAFKLMQLGLVAVQISAVVETECQGCLYSAKAA